MKTKTKIFFDCEFTGLHQNTTLISIGFISECGTKTFYAEFTDYDKMQLDGWLVDNVISKLLFSHKITVVNDSWENWITDKGKYSNALEFTLANKDMSRFECIGKKEMVTNRLTKWFEQFDDVEIWSDCLSYDWVLFCELFGGAFKIPENIFYIPFDLCTLLKEKGIDPDINREELAQVENRQLPNGLFPEKATDIPKHNAFWDAQVIKWCYENVQKNNS